MLKTYVEWSLLPTTIVLGKTDTMSYKIEMAE